MKEPFVYVNGVKVNLLEDCRISLYKTFPKGTLLYDMSCVPPSPVMLGEDEEDNGVSFTKLRPTGQYAAYARDQHTGSLFVPSKQYVCVYVTNLPFNATPELLYRCFENYGSVKDAEVFHGKDTSCDGRGYVVLHKAEKLALLPPVIQIQSKHFVYVEISDCLPPKSKHFLYYTPDAPPPPRRTHNLVSGGPRESNSGGGAGGIRANLPQPRSSTTRLAKMGNGGAPAAFPIGTNGAKNGREGGGAAGDTFFYAVYVSARDVSDRTLRTSPVNESEFYYCLENRGNVLLIVLLPESATVYGCAKLLPKREGVTRDGVCYVEWLRRDLYLPDDALPASADFHWRDGVVLKSHVGARVVDAIMDAPLLDYPQEHLPRYGAEHSPPPPPAAASPLPISSSSPSNNVIGGGRGNLPPPPPPHPGKLNYTSPGFRGRGRGGAGGMTGAPPPPLGGGSTASPIVIPTPASKRLQQQAQPQPQ